MYFNRLFMKCGLLGLAAGLIMVSTAARAADGCADFQPLSGDIAGMHLVDHTVYADPALGAAISYSGEDGGFTYFRYDLGFNKISDRTLLAATEHSVEEVGAMIRVLRGDIVRIRKSGEVHMVNEVDVQDVVVISKHDGATSINILGIGSDGRCLHKIHYSPDMTGIGRDGRNSEGLLVFERFERVLSEMAVYFCLETCVTEL